MPREPDTVRGLILPQGYIPTSTGNEALHIVHPKLGMGSYMS